MWLLSTRFQFAYFSAVLALDCFVSGVYALCSFHAYYPTDESRLPLLSFVYRDFRFSNQYGPVWKECYASRHFWLVESRNSL